MKLVLSTITAAIAVTAATAGTMAAPAVETAMVEAAPMSNGSGAWLIPLAIIAILALTLTNDEPTRIPG